MKNIYEEIAIMRRGMRKIGYTNEEIEKATEEVTAQEGYTEAMGVIKKYWK